MFDMLAEDLKHTGWKFIKSNEVCKTKQGYFDLLNKSKIVVSFADQETWGIAMQEALFEDCFPVVPNKLSYKEMYFERYRFDTYTQAKELVLQSMRDPLASDLVVLARNKEILLNKGEQAITNMIKEFDL